jgi:RNA-directed DNA polymerase
MSVLIEKTPQQLREGFFNLKTRKDIADLLDLTEKQLNFHLYVLPLEKRYTVFRIAKKMGGIREISAPISPIKIIQRKLKQVLEEVYQPKPSTQGFIRDRSIVTNARKHKKPRYVLNVDLQDFFPSIHFGRVRGMFMGNPYYRTDEVATILAQICCFNGIIPQGAPTSPIISNMICSRLDAKLQQLAKANQCIYSRYADDITFSTGKSKFPQALAMETEIGQIVIGNDLSRVISENGFKANLKKTRLQLRYQRQEVTGLTVNQHPNIKRRDLMQLRGILHAWKKYNLEQTAQRYFEVYAKHKYPDPTQRRPPFQRIILGKIEYIGMVKGKSSSVYKDLLIKFQKLAPEYVSVKQMESIPLTVPLIYTEGPSDQDHIEAALIDLQSKGLFQNLNLKFYRDRTFNGYADLLQLLKLEARKKDSLDCPHIFIFDRDVQRIMSEIVKYDNYKTWENGLYSIAIPVPKHQEESPSTNICIEFCYQDQDIFRKDIEGKRLFLSEEFNSSTGKHFNEELHCTDIKKLQGNLKIISEKVFDANDKNVALSKTAFSQNILKRAPGFENIDFSGFKPLFETIRMIISDFNSGEN